ncbi:hypothetical protein HJC23_007418 [Cyclotella cryptica]|uniref:ABC1 atypical kinase-like domain-containing protein n=1 Tax=Cyclotella cryptica TaxID=29204 RepID=A0ABD3QHW5_9STRA|eukprot:CCRYP_005162-RA/>CCRYP_005162-RA protein AED:0.02 eAED:0.02 QI:209/1/1/1/0.5/0.33/3/1052/620
MLSTAAAVAARRSTRRTALVLATGAATTTVVASTAVVYSERGLGLKREVDFWSSVAPVVWDYWWHSFQSSPKVKWEEACRRRVDSGTHEQGQTDYDEERKVLLNRLHERNAPKIYNVMLRLGGLYIKLGQVLSVTALPIPEKYREYFRSLQSNVPNHQDFVSTVQPTLERELGAPLHEIFDSIDEIPCGAASIGQAHRATLKETKEEVIVKVQYPDARWQVPADIECVGDLLQLCVWFGIVDESTSRLSYEEFARQFLSELDYENEVRNLKRVYESSLDPRAPYLLRGVVLPRVFDEYCTKQVITMSYLPGRKFEEETKRQLSLIGVDTKRSIHSIIRETGDKYETFDDKREDAATLSKPLALSSQQSTLSWKARLSSIMSTLVSVDFVFALVRFSRRVALWSQGATVKWIQLASSFSIVPPDWKEWADERQNLILQNMRLDWTEEAVHTLFDVHGYQILNQGLFNADPHPGNILVDFPMDVNKKPTIGLIDYGQCKHLTPTERVKIARLILSIAEKESDDVIADHFRTLGIKTKNDSTRFLSDFGRLMFGSLEAKHLDHSWHKDLHKEDRVLYFPKELSMVYRTALLLRGLAMSLQFNPSVGEVWKHHALEAIKAHDCG